MGAPLPANETERLAALHRCEILDTPREDFFDDIARLASAICGTPMSLVTFIDAGRQWFKSKSGVDIDVSETPREEAFCAHAILEDRLLVVPDASQDARFADNPYVTGPFHVRFYAGAPVVTRDGHRIGTLCVLDREPRVLTAAQLEMLQALSRSIAQELELRRSLADRERAETDLLRAHALLEVQVAQRTAEISEANDRLTEEIVQRREIEARLRESEARFRRIIETAGEGIWEVGPDWTTTYANAQLGQMLGWEPHEMVGRHLFDFMDDEWRRIANEYMRRREGGVKEAHDFKFVRRDGSALWAIVSANPILDESGRFVGALATVTDVTERRRIEQALRESEERFQEMASSIRENFWMVDASTSRLLYTSPAFEQIWGMSLDVFCEDVSRLIDSIHPEDRHIVVRALERRAQGLDTNDEYRIVRPDGDVRWIRDRSYRIRGGPAGELRFAGIAEDITDRKLAEEALRRSHEELEVRVAARTEELRRVNAALVAEIEERKHSDLAVSENKALYLLLAEHATEIVSRHGRDSRFLYASPACRTLLGYDASELVGRQGLDLVHPDDVDRVREYFRGILEGTSYPTAQFRIRREDGTYTWFETNCKGVADPISGETTEVISVTRDISERKMAEERERRLNAGLAHVDRLSSMGEMASGLAHELNQPLSAIVNYLTGSIHRMRAGGGGAGGSRGAAGAGGPPDVIGALESASAEARRAGAIIQRLREFVRRRDPHESTIRMDELIQEVISLAAAELRAAEVRPRVDLSGPGAEVLGDRIQIAQVILNLVRNAVEAMGEIPPKDRALEISCAAAGDGAVKVVVRDSGTGLSPDAFSHLFEPFFTTKQEGMGMGLAICKSIIAAHGGHIWAEPNPAGGTAVGFVLPGGRNG